MNDQGSGDTMVEADLERWAEAQRRGGVGRAGDLDGLLARARAQQVRRRVGVAVAAGAAAVALCAGVALAVPDARDQLEVAGPGVSATVADPAPPTTTGLPFDPAPPSTADQVWAVEISYDPDVWSADRLRDELRSQVDPATAGPPFLARLLSPSGSTLVIAVVGDGAEAEARVLMAVFDGRPGIDSVRLGSTSYTGSPPG